MSTHNERVQSDRGDGVRKDSDHRYDNLRAVAVTLLWVLGFVAVLVAALYVLALIAFMAVS